MSDFDSLPLTEAGEHGRVQQTPSRRWFALGGVTAFVLFAGVAYTNFRMQSEPIRMHLAGGHSLARKFAARVLSDDMFEGTMHTVWKPQGAADPDAMGFTSKFVQGTSDKPVGMVTFKAKAGKAADLKKQFEDIFSAGADVMETVYGKDAAEDYKKVYVVADPAGDLVTVSAKDVNTMPFSWMHGEGKKDPPQYDFSMSFGSSLADMVKNGAASIATVSKGIMCDGSTKMAAAIFDAWVEEYGLTGYAKWSMEMSKMTTSQKYDMLVEYKEDADFTGLATFEEILDEASGMIGEYPIAMREKMQGLDEFVDELVSIKMDGLPGQLMYVMELKGVNNAPVLKHLIENAPKAKTPFAHWSG